MNKEFSTCIIKQDDDGDYKCSVKRNGVWVHAFGLTEGDAFDSMVDKINEMNKNKIKMETVNNNVRRFDFSNREWLIEMRESALEQANTPQLNQSWERVFIQLADAFDRIDAMVARTELKH